MFARIDLGEIVADVVRKDIKNVHLSVYPPNGRVRIAAPQRMDLDTIRVYAISKLGWIKKQQKKLREQEREPPRQYLNRESHYVWGRRYLLKVIEAYAAPRIQLSGKTLRLHVRPGADRTKREAVLDSWYRQQIKDALPPLLARWEPNIGVKAQRLFVQRMKTKWGSCSHRTGNIRLNTELAKKPPECLEYVLVHELAHFVEPSHNSRFVALLDQLMPKWRFYRDELNRLPVRHEDWVY